MPFLFHPDIKSQYFHASFLQQGVVNIYQYLKINKENLPYKDSFNYPPLVYFFQGSWIYIASPLLGQPFKDWLNYWGEGWYFNPQLYRQLFVLKIPYLTADILIGVLLTQFLEERFRKKALFLWFFNPLTIYIIYGLSNFDIIPTFLTILALFYFKKKSYLYSGIAMGAAISFKLYPLLFLPLFTFPMLTSKLFKKAFIFLLGCVLAALIFLPFLGDFLKYADSGLLKTLLGFKFSFGQAIQIPVFYILYAVILIFSIRSKANWDRIAFLMLMVLFCILSISHFHPQWFLWLFPFFVIFAAQRLNLLIYAVPLFTSFIISILAFEDRFLTLGIFSPIIFNIYDAGLLEQTVFSKIDKTTTLVSAQIVFGLASLLVLYSIFRYINERS